MIYHFLTYPGATLDQLPRVNATTYEEASLWSYNLTSDRRVYGADISVSLTLGDVDYSFPYNFVVVDNDMGGLTAYYIYETRKVQLRESPSGNSYTINYKAQYCAVLTIMLSGDGLQHSIDFTAQLDRYSTADSTLSVSITDEPISVMDQPIEVLDGTYSSIGDSGQLGLVITMAADSAGTPLRDPNATTTSLTDIKSSPVTVLFVGNNDPQPTVLPNQDPDYTDTIIKQFYREVETYLSQDVSIIQRIQLVPLTWLRYSLNDIQSIAFGDNHTTQICYLRPIDSLIDTAVTLKLPGGEYTKAEYLGQEYIVRQYGEDVLRVPIYPFIGRSEVRLYVGYSLYNGVNPYVVLNSSTKVPYRAGIHLPEIISVANNYTSWYNDNKASLVADSVSGVIGLVAGVGMTIAGAVGAAPTGGLSTGLIAGGVATAASSISSFASSAVSRSRQVEEARKGYTSSGTSAPVYGNDNNVYFLAAYHTKPSDKIAQTKFYRHYGYAVNKLLDGLPVNSPRQNYYYMHGVVYSYVDESPLLRSVSESDQREILNQQLQRGVTVWVGGSTGDYSENPS